MAERDAAQNPEAAFAFIPLERLTPNAYNARRFTENMTPQRQARFLELTASVREKGVIEPLLVRPLDDDRYEVIAGERRYRAGCRAAEELARTQAEYTVPCMIRQVSEDDAFDLMLIENLQRDDLTPFETAQAFQSYLERHAKQGDAVAELAFRTGIPAHAIRRQVRLLALPREALAAWNEGKITQSHAEMFTRLDDDAQVLTLLADCIRLKLSTRELAERIGATAPDIDKAFFDRGECQVCHHNSAVQSGLFADAAASGKCGNPACFEAKQGAFLTEYWLESKAAAAYGTRGFRFGHRMGQERCEGMFDKEIAGRCLECDRFITMLRLNGAVVSGYAQSCTGPVACFDELYRAPVVQDTVESEKEEEKDWPVRDKQDVAAAPQEKTAPTPPATPPVKSPPKPATQKPAAPPPPKEETGPVYSAARGEKCREAFFREAIPATELAKDPKGEPVLCLTLLSLVLSSTAARKVFTAGQGLSSSCKSEDMAVKIFEDMTTDELQGELRTAALAHLLDHVVSPAVRRVVAANLGLDVAKDWRFTRDYLDQLTCSEIVRIGEEPGVDIWNDDQVKAYRTEHFKGKALRSLKKQDLVDMILLSGAELKGRVPKEVLG